MGLKREVLFFNEENFAGHDQSDQVDEPPNVAREEQEHDSDDDRFIAFGVDCFYQAVDAPDNIKKRKRDDDFDNERLLFHPTSEFHNNVFPFF